MRRVELLDQDVAAGQRWVDVTAVGARPQMETTVLERPVRWSERGVWGPFAATLTLVFTPTDSGCSVRAEFDVRAGGVARPVAAVLARAARAAVPGDLRRAARILSERPRGQ